ncbi:MAG: TIR domain-containing protein [Dehalococcoidia bacterium]|nr:TIR domain-containing protein [Dehalococcoidia bacterium]MYK62195.1 TIR domain-containing protein [Chloroflexota bacterium]
MSGISIFVSFEFDKDVDLKNNFYRQARDHSPHRVRDFSLREAYPTNSWKDRARSAIRECDAVIVLVGPDTHNAPGVRTEVEIARLLSKPVFQVIPKGRPYSGVAGIEDRMRWNWKLINKRLDEILASRS